MNAQQLFLAGGEPAINHATGGGLWACGKCGVIATTGEEYAEECCQPLTCPTCGKPRQKYFTYCDDCGHKVVVAKREAKEAEDMARAEKLEFWDDWVLISSC